MIARLKLAMATREERPGSSAEFHDREQLEARLCASIRAEFPALAVHVVKGDPAEWPRPNQFDPTKAGESGAPADRVVLELSDWLSRDVDVYREDERMRTGALHGPFELVMRVGPGEAPLCAPILTRYQRLVTRRNEASRGERFDGVLARHRSLFALEKPLVLADYEHALDTWHWILRLDPEAGLAVQIAALFHDIERLASEADARIEHHAPDYQAFKDAHASRGARAAVLALRGIDLLPDDLDRVFSLIVHHEHRGSSESASLLSDADALSFFSLNSAGFLDYFGEPHTRRKIAFTLGRLRPASRRWLDRIRYRPDVGRLVRDAMRLG